MRIENEKKTHQNKRCRKEIITDGKTSPNNGIPKESFDRLINGNCQEIKLACFRREQKYDSLRVIQ